MKLKIGYSLFIASMLGVCFVTLKSDINGKFNSTSGCGGCHGSNPNSATTVSLNGFSGNYVTGQTYNLSFTVSNASLPKAGFNLQASAGTFTAGSGNKTNNTKTQLTHTAPGTAAAGVTTFNFQWTAPANPSPVIFSGVGNAVNDNGSDDANDQWNALSPLTVIGSFPNSIETIQASKLEVYPNPTTDLLTIKGIESEETKIEVYNLKGQKMKVNHSIAKGGDINVFCNHLQDGHYVIIATNNKKVYQANFIKK